MASSGAGTRQPLNIRQSFLDGMAWIALFLGIMGLLAVIAFHFPEYLTTPTLREVYQEAQVPVSYTHHRAHET